MASAPSASRSPEAATPTAASHAQPAADLNALTTHDDFLLELGQIMHGRAAIRPVDTLEAAVAAMGSSRRGQVLVIDARDVRNVRAAVDAAQAGVPRAAIVVFAEGAAEKQLAAALKGSKVFALLPTPIDARKTQAVLEGAISDALTNNTAAHAAHAAQAAAPGRTADLTIGAFRPESSRAYALRLGGPQRIILLVVAAAAVTGAAGAAYWYFTHPAVGPATAPAPKAPAAVVPAPAAESVAPATSNDNLVLQGKVDELLEKARLAMKERRFTEPTGDNALLYYRSAAAADATNAEARDGLQRVAGVLAGRFDDALNGARFDEASATLASFKAAAAAGDPRVGVLEQRLYAALIAKALSEGDVNRAAALVRQAQQSSSVGAEQLARWRADIARHQEDARVQRLAGLVVDRIREGRLVEGDDSAKAYLQQLQATAASGAISARAARDYTTACLRKAREAALAKNDADKARWLAEARTAGASAAEMAAFERDLAGAQQKAAQAENERLLQQARERVKDGRLTDPAQDSAAYFLAQVQSAEPQNAGLAAVGHEFAQQLLQRARTSVLAGKSGDADLALAKRWGADAKDLAAVQQLQVQGKGKTLDAATLTASLKRLRATPPDYPRDALNQKITGTVTLEFTVDTRGETRDIHVIEAAPPGVFDDAAISAVKHWRYAPPVVNGTPVDVPVKTRVRFELPK